MPKFSVIVVRCGEDTDGENVINQEYITADNKKDAEYDAFLKYKDRDITDISSCEVE